MKRRTGGKLEGVDDQLITFERERRMNPEALPPAAGRPRGRSWSSSPETSQDGADAKAQALIHELRGTET